MNYKYIANISALIVGTHILHVASNYLYWIRCGGFMNSIFSHGSPTCKGLRWVSDTTAINIINIFHNLI
jgi:hypothetical protein